MTPVLPPKEKEELDEGPPNPPAPDRPPAEPPDAVEFESAHPSAVHDWSSFKGNPANFSSESIGPTTPWHCPFYDCDYYTISQSRRDIYHIKKCAASHLNSLRAVLHGAPTSQLVEVAKGMLHPEYLDTANKVWCTECGKILGSGGRQHKGIDDAPCAFTPPPRRPKEKLSQVQGAANSQRPSAWVEERRPPTAEDPNTEPGSALGSDLLSSADLAWLTDVPLSDIIQAVHQTRVVDTNDHRLNASLADAWLAALLGTTEVIGNRNDATTWRLYLLLGACTLRVPANMRHTRAEWDRWEKKAHDRLSRWRRGDIAPLWEEFLEEIGRAHAPSDTAPGAPPNAAKKRRQVLRLTRLGRFADAARALTAEPLAALNEDTRRVLQEKFPPAPEGAPMPPSTLDPGEDVPLTKECVRACLASFPRGSGAGLSALTPDILRYAVSTAMRAQRGEELLDSMVRLLQILGKGQAPPEIAPWLCGGRLIPVGAKVRPIIVSDVLARLCSKAILSLGLDSTTHDRVFKGIQGGVGEKGAIERTVHMLRQEMQSRADQVDFAILQVDFRNGFNSVHRAPIMEQLNEHAPLLGRWFCWAHMLPLTLVLSDGTTLEAPTGTGQGDPASPAYFAMTLQPVLDHIADTWGESVGVHRAFLDDLVISGPAPVMVEILQFLREDTVVLRRGLTVRPDKCCIFMPNQGVPEGLQGQYGIPEDIQLATADSGITALGVPLGSNDYVTRHLDDVARSVQQFGDNVATLELSQLELLLHTYSGGLNRVMYLYRCLPAESLGAISRACKEESDRLLQRLTAPASSVTAAMTAQAHLPRRYGGLGLIEAEHVGDAAFIAATTASLPQQDHNNTSATLAHNLDFISALNQFNRLVNPKDRVTSDALLLLKPAERSQKALTKRVHDHQFDSLALNMSQAALARIKDQASCGASSWLQPSFIRGKPIIGASIFPLLIVRYLGGEFRAAGPLICPRGVALQAHDRVRCRAEVDTNLLHVTNSCKALLVERHKTLASALHRICNEAGRAASTEVQCIPGSNSVPADLYIYPNAPDAKPIAIDVQVVSPAADTPWSAEPGRAVHQGGRKKNRKFERDVESARDKAPASDESQPEQLQSEKQELSSTVDFVPFSISTYGLLGHEARAFISMAASWMCKRWVWSVAAAEEYIRRVILSSVMAFMGAQMLTTLNCSNRT